MPPYAQFLSFIYTRDLPEARHFYETILELPLIRDQGACLIFRISADGFLGVCEREEETGVNGIIITLVADDVDARFQEAVARGAEALQTPRHNSEYSIYHCFLKDPAGYRVEIQRFDDPLA